MVSAHVSIAFRPKKRNLVYSTLCRKKAVKVGQLCSRAAVMITITSEIWSFSDVGHAT
jgi:hypothetical protein